MRRSLASTRSRSTRRSSGRSPPTSRLVGPIPTSDGACRPASSATARSSSASLGDRPPRAGRLPAHRRGGPRRAGRAHRRLQPDRAGGFRAGRSGVFRGRVDYRRLRFVHFVLMKSTWLLFRRAPEGDFRNWEAIRSWAASLCPMLFAEESGQGAPGSPRPATPPRGCGRSRGLLRRSGSGERAEVVSGGV
jgi:hypothetical protein